MVGHGDVSGDAHLTGERAPFAHLRGAGDAHLCAQHGVALDFHVVSHLYQVVNLHTLVDDGGAHRSTIHAGVGAKLHVVLQHGDADLGNLLVAVGRGGEAEAVGAYDAARVQDATVTNLTVVINGAVGIEDAIAAHLGIGAYGGVGVQLCAVANDGIVAHGGKGSQIDILANLRCRCHEGQRVDARALGLHTLIEHQQATQSLTRALHAYERRSHGLCGLETVGHQHHGGGCLIDIGLVFGVGEEGQGSFHALFDFGKGVHGLRGVAFNGAVEVFCDLLSCEIHVGF